MGIQGKMKEIKQVLQEWIIIVCLLGTENMINSTVFVPKGPFKNKNLRLSSSQKWIVEFPLVLFTLRTQTIGNVLWLKNLSRGIYKDLKATAD